MILDKPARFEDDLVVPAGTYEVGTKQKEGTTIVFLKDFQVEGMQVSAPKKAWQEDFGASFVLGRQCCF